MGRSGLRRRGAWIATIGLTAGLVVAAIALTSGESAPAPVVWRDHVVETTIPSAP
jgi:hypothetical protein